MEHPPAAASTEPPFVQTHLSGVTLEATCKTVPYFPSFLSTVLTKSFLAPAELPLDVSDAEFPSHWLRVLLQPQAEAPTALQVSTSPQLQGGGLTSSLQSPGALDFCAPKSWASSPSCCGPAVPWGVHLLNTSQNITAPHLPAASGQTTTTSAGKQ